MTVKLEYCWTVVQSPRLGKSKSAGSLPNCRRVYPIKRCVSAAAPPVAAEDLSGGISHRRLIDRPQFGTNLSSRHRGGRVRRYGPVPTG